MPSTQADIIYELQADILRLEGFKPIGNTVLDFGLGPVVKAFPNGAFPIGAVHEFLPAGGNDTASMDGFVAGLLASLMGSSGASLWVSTSGSTFPSALKSFGIQPDRLIFVDLLKQKEAMWVVEEALKCGALTAVVGELPDLDFTASRRLQLAVEQSGVTGFVLRSHRSKLNPTASVSRWKIASLPSESLDGLPGIGSPQWKVELLRVRNGKPGIWEVRWANGKFQPVCSNTPVLHDQKRKAG